VGELTGTRQTGLSIDLLDHDDPRQYSERNPAFLYIQSLPSEASRITVTSFTARFVRHWNAMVSESFLPQHLAAFSVADIEYEAEDEQARDNRNFKTAIAAPWRTLTNGIFVAVMEQVRRATVDNPRSDQMNPSTYNSYLAAIKGIARKAYLARLIPSDEFNLIADNRSIKYTREKGTGVLIEEVQEVVDMCLQEGTKAGLRDALLFLLLFGCGPRRSELANIDLRDVDLIRGRIVVTGKGNKKRYLRLQPYTLDILMEWIGEAEITEGALLRRIARGDHVAHYSRAGSTKVTQYDSSRKMAGQNGNVPARSPRITAAGIYDIVKRRMLANPKITRIASPHSFRRGFITFLHRKGVDVITIAELVGHDNVNTTRGYITDLEEQLDSAAQLISFGQQDAP
jgi:site-specific recombinase XerD